MRVSRYGVAALAVVGMVVMYQNCSRIGSLSAAKTSSMRGGNGDGYDGKPEDGTYYRTIPGDDCSADTSAPDKIEIFAGVITAEIRNPAECTSSESSDLQVSDVQFSPWNKSMLGFGEGIFRKLDAPPDYTPPPLQPEAWCRFSTSPLEGIDVVLNEDQNGARTATFVFGTKDPQTGALTSRTDSAFAVNRTYDVAAKEISYTAPSFSLIINLAAYANGQSGNFSGSLMAIVDGSSYDQSFLCRMGGVMDGLTFTLGFSGNSSPVSPVGERTFTELNSPSWLLTGVCDPTLGSVLVSGDELMGASTPCSGGNFSLALNYPYPGLPVGPRQVQITQMPASPHITTLFKTNSSAAQNFTLSVAKSGGGSGTVISLPPSGGINCGATCSQSFPAGTLVTMSATPTSGSAFTGWSGACTGTSSCTVTMSSAQNVTATFALLGLCTTAKATPFAGDMTAEATAMGLNLGGGNFLGCDARNSANGQLPDSLPADLSPYQGIVIFNISGTNATYNVNLPSLPGGFIVTTAQCGGSSINVNLSGIIPKLGLFNRDASNCNFRFSGVPSGSLYRFVNGNGRFYIDGNPITVIQMDPGFHIY